MDVGYYAPAARTTLNLAVFIVAPVGVRMARGGPGPTCGDPGPRPQVLSISTSGTRGDTGPVPEREAGPGPLVR